MLTGSVIPWLTAKIETGKVKQSAKKFNTWTALVEKVVDAAYRMFTTDNERKQYNDLGNMYVKNRVTTASL